LWDSIDEYSKRVVVGIDDEAGGDDQKEDWLIIEEELLWKRQEEGESKGIIHEELSLDLLPRQETR
jgi:hypothetical protein